MQKSTAKPLKTYSFDDPVEILRPKDLHGFVKRQIKLDRETREHLLIVPLDAGLRTAEAYVAAIGSMRDMTFEVHDVFRKAILDDSKSLLIVHNHPYQSKIRMNPIDRQMTKTLYESGLVIHIPVLDHMIVGADGYLSCREKGIVMPKSDTYELDEEFMVYRKGRIGGGFKIR